jgi:NAD(P)-dependent dehydrogenase (short-subunit alcohol dehydrogenase family)
MIFLAHFRHVNEVQTMSQSGQANQSQTPQSLPPQKQDQQPGLEWQMSPKPQTEPRHRGADKLKGKVALITGGDSGIGRAVAQAFAREGADIVIGYLNEHKDAQETKSLVEKEGRRCITIAGDIRDSQVCRRLVDETVRQLGKLDILVNNAAEQHTADSIDEITEEQLRRTFETNIFSMFFITQAALPHLKEGSSIINTTSVNAYRGSDQLLDYSATKGAILAFTRSLAKQLSERKIRVNGVAPGPIWTPLIPASFDPEKVASFGKQTLMQRPGQPNEVSTCYVFLASDDGSYMTGQTLHPDGGDFLGG